MHGNVCLIVYSCLQVLGEIQSPRVCLRSCELHINNAYVNIPMDHMITLHNIMMIPAQFNWRKQVRKGKGLPQRKLPNVFIIIHSSSYTTSCMVMVLSVVMLSSVRRVVLLLQGAHVISLSL